MDLVIGRQLSYADNRMLSEAGRSLERWKPPSLILADTRDEKDLLDSGMEAPGRRDLSDNGYSQAIIIQGLDIKYHGGADWRDH